MEPHEASTSNIRGKIGIKDQGQWLHLVSRGSSPKIEILKQRSLDRKHIWLTRVNEYYLRAQTTPNIKSPYTQYKSRVSITMLHVKCTRPPMTGIHHYKGKKRRDTGHLQGKGLTSLYIPRLFYQGQENSSLAWCASSSTWDTQAWAQGGQAHMEAFSELGSVQLTREELGAEMGAFLSLSGFLHPT